MYKVHSQPELVIGRSLVQLVRGLFCSQENTIRQIEGQLVITMGIEGHIVVVSCPVEKVSVYSVVIHREASSIEYFKHSENLKVSSHVFGVFLICGHIEKAEAKT